NALVLGQGLFATVYHSLRVELIDCRLQAVEFVTAVGEWRLRDEEHNYQEENDLFPAFHFFGAAGALLILKVYGHNMLADGAPKGRNFFVLRTPGSFFK